MLISNNMSHVTICFLGSDWQYVKISSDTGFASNRPHTTIWTNGDPVRWHIYASSGQSKLKCRSLKTKVCYLSSERIWNLIYAQTKSSVMTGYSKVLTCLKQCWHIWISLLCGTEYLTREVLLYHSFNQFVHISRGWDWRGGGGGGGEEGEMYYSIYICIASYPCRLFVNKFVRAMQGFIDIIPIVITDS